MTTLDDVLKAADDYRFSQDPSVASKARWDLGNAITSYAQAWSDEQKIAENKALEAARLLCANLHHGGHGHMTLVQNFENLDAEVG